MEIEKDRGEEEEEDEDEDEDYWDYKNEMWVSQGEIRKDINAKRKELKEAEEKIKQQQLDDMLSYRYSSEDMMNGFKEDNEENSRSMPEPGSYNPFDRDWYRHQIIDHKTDSQHQFSEFELVATNRFDESAANFKFWCSSEEVKERFQKELMSYLFEFNTKFN